MISFSGNRQTAPGATLALAGACLVASSNVLVATAALAQAVSSASLSGIVLDTSGKPLGGARITISSTGFARTLRSGADGKFSVPVAPGSYDVTVSLSGFQTAENDGIRVGATEARSVSISLANASLQTIGRLSVSRATSINRSTAAVSSVSGQTFVDQGQQQVQNVIDQIPGVEINRGTSNLPAGNTSISLRGAQPYESQVLIDGHPVVTSANGASGFNATFLNATLLGGVEVQKGPGALPNTIEDAVGGSINFQTPPITGGFTAQLLGGYDSFNGISYGVRASDTIGKLGILVGVADYQTPGYLKPQTIYGGAVFPAVTAGTANDPHAGVLNFGYPATSNFSSFSQLAKLSYNFSPQTSILLEQYSTQSNNDETGSNYQYVDARIVPCITATAATCTAGVKGNNYTSTPNLGQIGQIVPINLYAPYPNTTQFDNEPIYSGELRTVIGPGSLLARYYTGAINRIITQQYNPVAVIPCTSPACPTHDDLTTNPPTYGSYQGEPYVEDTIDILHGIDAQYTVPFGANTITAGFDRHVDTATFGEYDPTVGPPTFAQNINVQSIAYSLRGTFQLLPKLSLSSGNYFSSTTYVGSRFDPRLGLAYRLTPNASVRASWGTAYVAPYYGILNQTPQFGQGTLTLPTTNFRPETSSGYDLGADFNLGRDTLVSTDAYLTNIYNRYASVTQQKTGTFGNQMYSMVTQNGNQANVRQEGVEFQLLHAPRVGLGFHTAVDILRAYAYNQDPNVSVDSIFGAGTPGNYVQLPSYPFSKIRNDLFYTFGDGAQVRGSSTTYGANNAFGEKGFTEFDGQIRLALKHRLDLSIGATNIFNHDDYRAGGIYDGGYTYQELSGGAGYTTQIFAQPRTLFIQLQRNIGPGGKSDLPYTSL